MSASAVCYRGSNTPHSGTATDKARPLQFAAVGKSPTEFQLGQNHKEEMGSMATGSK
jgi:hypothetical protein